MTEHSPRWRRQIAAVAVVLAALPAVLVAPVALADDVAPEPDVPGLTDSARLSTAALATGVALDAAGAPLAEGSLVILQAWPSGESLSRLAVGDAVKTAPVGFARTTADGRFELRASDDALLQQYADKRGAVELEVVTLGAESLGAYSFTAFPGEAAAAKAAAASEITVQSVVDAWNPAAEPEGTKKACGTVKVATHDPVYVTVGAAYATFPTKIDFTYTNGASSEVGVAYSVTGAYGTWTQSGTSSFGSTSSVTFPTVGGGGTVASPAGREWRTQFQYGRYLTSCVTNGVPAGSYYTARADNYVGGGVVNYVSAGAATYCTPFPAGSTFTKTSTTGYTFASGSGASQLFGISLSSKTNYSAATSVKFTFPQAKQLCGTGGYPGSTPLLLVSK